MAIIGRFYLEPRGDSSKRALLCTIGIHSLDDRPDLHRWWVVLEDGRHFDGEIPKTKSGHQNVLHVLREILSDDLLAKLGEDYIRRGGAA